MGRLRMRLPVAAAMALQRAGAKGGTPVRRLPREGPGWGERHANRMLASAIRATGAS